MTTTIRIHRHNNDAGKEHDGFPACDFRGTNFVGDNEGDHHQTIEEIDVDESSPLIAAVLAEGPAENEAAKKMFDRFYDHVNVPQEQRQYLRVGVWDKVAPGN